VRSRARSGTAEDQPGDPVGTLFVVGTPIGNLGDITLRAIEVLGQVAGVAAEDTRRARALLTHLGLGGKDLIRLDSHAPEHNLRRIVDCLVAGQSMALVTDAGMPSISDPGALLVRAVVARGLPLSVVPGPSAVTAAVAASGLVAGPFWFVGFLPRKGSGRRELVARIAACRDPVVLFEHPGRTRATLLELGASSPERLASVCRELTKLHEQIVRGPLAELGGQTAWRGEVTIVLGPHEPPQAEPHAETLDRRIVERLRRGDSTKDIARELGAETGLGRRAVYARVQALRPLAGGVRPAGPTGRGSAKGELW
jgi:16S rRNA (cytidine1402-2'-O)-methyltransferase